MSERADAPAHAPHAARTYIHADMNAGDIAARKPAGSQLPGTWNFGCVLRTANFCRGAWKTKTPAQGRQNEAKEGH